MKYDFDEVIERRGTDSVKWDGVKNVWGRDDLIPMWVADMDFRTPPFVMDALRKRLDHEILGYTFACEEWYTSICNWLHKRHQWDVTRDMLTFVPGIVRGQAFALQCFTNPGDKVMVMTPVYHPFFLVTERLGREVVYSPLDLYDGHYHVDFERFSRDIRGCKVLILCNPHNPGGRVWTVEELCRIAAVCKDNGTLVISDEIHADLTLPPYKHHPFATVSEAAAQNSLTFMAPSKAFNMPGLGSSYAIAVNDAIRLRFREFMEAGEFCEGHLLAYIGAAAAYTHGEEWLEQMLEYVKGNIDFTEKYLKGHIPGIGMIRPQASYLVFLDCRALGLPHEKLIELFVDKARLALNDGTMFGQPGEGFMRLNIGCPRSALQQALQQLSAAVAELKGFS
ncbi:MalY/PatB family protein [Bacteroides gallinarum]|uniref:MalY/PatB family protein n=1 Tax=Bacteroides gallinarum TaxID=376806 RepID=UPI000372A680|nr:PatB family C-S lyase [Bacteroides gallinarum]